MVCVCVSHPLQYHYVDFNNQQQTTKRPLNHMKQVKFRKSNPCCDQSLHSSPRPAGNLLHQAISSGWVGSKQIFDKIAANYNCIYVIDGLNIL